MDVVIGIDPHKASHHAFAVDDREVELSKLSVRATRRQTERLLAWAEPFTSRRIRAAVLVSGTSLTELFGIGPIIAAMLIGYSGDIARFANRDHYAAYNGTAPVEFSSGGRTVHRLSQRGNRNLNHALHMAAICQTRHPHAEGRAYVDRKVAAGKTKREAIRALKRRISNAVYRQLVIDASRHSR
jgi:transposase